MRRFLRTLLIVSLLSFLFVPLVFAQDGGQLPTDLNQVLNFLSTGGAAVVAAVVVSWLAEKLPAFGSLPALAKFGIQAALSVGLGAGAWYLLTYRPDLVVTLTPIFAILVLSLGPLIVNQVYHAVVNANRQLRHR